MARPPVTPTSVGATAPEAFMVLHLRMRVVEEQASALVQDLEALGAAGQRYGGHRAQLEQRLNAIHEEHLQEMKVVQQESMKLRQQLSDVKEAEDKAKEEVQRLSAALEIMTASKMNVVIAAEELRNTKQKMNCRLQELTEHLSQEISLRESLEESQAIVMCHVQDMETTVEAERKQVRILQQDCQELRKDVQLAQVRLQEEEERTAQLEQQCTQLKVELDFRNCIISQLGEEAKNAQLSFSKQRRENLQLQSKMTALRETAEKVQVLNDHLSQKCSELSTTLQSAVMENAKLISDHQTMLKAEQEETYKLQDQDSLLNTAHAKILGELQSVQHERAQLQRELEALHAEHSKHGQKASLAEDAATTWRQLLECTIARLQGQLETALQEEGSLLAEKEDLQIRKTANGMTQERNKWEAGKRGNELEMVSMKFTLQTLEEENKRLLDRLAALVQEQQVQEVLAELTDSKNKLACDKGKLQHQLDAPKDDNSKAAATLQHVLACHKKMQAALDAAQNELEHKDTEISNLRKDKSQTQQKILRLETELEHCQAKLVAMGRQHSSQAESLRKALEGARRDKKLLNLEEVLQVNNTLQSKLIQTQHELKSKETEHQQLRVCRELFMEKVKTEEKMYAEHAESVKKQFQSKQEASRKAACQESAEVKKSLQETSSKLAEVSHANRLLQQKVIELEKSLFSYREKLKRHRVQVGQCLACKANTERVKETESELKRMEARKEEYQKNYGQSQDIQKFVSELKTTQSKMQVLLKNQCELQVQNRQLETQLEAERRQRQQLETECQKLEKAVKYLKKYKEEMQEKLKQASVESEQVTTSLEATHCWFTSKLDSLQLAVVKNHQPENPGEQLQKGAMTKISQSSAS